MAIKNEEREIVGELERSLGKNTKSFFPQGIFPDKIKRETFQSQTFIDQGYAFLPEIYGSWDRAIYHVRDANNKKTFVVVGKGKSSSPFDVGSAVVGVFDFRPEITVVYQCPSEGKIVETRLDTGEEVEYTGKHADSRILLMYIRSAIGKPVGVSD